MACAQTAAQSRVLTPPYLRGEGEPPPPSPQPLAPLPRSRAFGLGPPVNTAALTAASPENSPRPLTPLPARPLTLSPPATARPLTHSSHEGRPRRNGHFLHPSQPTKEKLLLISGRPLTPGPHFKRLYLTPDMPVSNQNMRVQRGLMGNIDVSRGRCVSDRGLTDDGQVGLSPAWRTGGGPSDGDLASEGAGEESGKLPRVLWLFVSFAGKSLKAQVFLAALPVVCISRL